MSSIFFGLIPTIRKKKLLRLEEKVKHLLWDVKLLYEIENELLNRLEEHGNKKRSLKTEVSRIISEKNYGRVLSYDVKPSVYAKQKNTNNMKKKLLFLMTLLAVSLFVMAEMRVYVYKKDGTKVPYVASTVDSIGFVNVHTIAFNANGGTGSMDVVRVKEGESITLPANGFTYVRAEFAGWNTKTDGSGTAYTDQSTITPTANMTLYAQWENRTSGVADGHEWVDLGLPSGTLWATCNVGADSPDKYGYYFAWGETTPKSTYTSSNYNYSSDPTTLPLEDDAAYTNWGTSWRMPTHAEFRELIDKCTWTWTAKGYKVTSEVNGNSIFLPAAGDRDESGLNYAGYFGHYWSSSRHGYYKGRAYYLFISSGDLYSYDCGRSSGLSVRPVLAK